MSDWMTLYARRDWNGLDNWWRHCENAEEVAAFLKRLQADVPKVARQNGMEQLTDHAHPTEAPDEWKGAAEILLLGELEAAVSGDPEPVPDQWRRSREEVSNLLRALKDAEEVTTGDPALSRVAHAKTALDMLDSIDSCVSMMANEIDPDCNNPDGREWLIAFAEEIVSIAFDAGAHTRAAIGKEIEGHAIRGQKTILSARQGGLVRRLTKAPMTAAVLARMEELSDRGFSISRAAQIAAKEGLGSSSNANRQLSKRYRPK